MNDYVLVQHRRAAKALQTAFEDKWPCTWKQEWPSLTLTIKPKACFFFSYARPSLWSRIARNPSLCGLVPFAYWPLFRWLRGYFLLLWSKARNFLTFFGVSHLTSPPHTPEHNGFAERRRRHIVESGLSLLSHAHLPLSFWSYSFATAFYLINRLPTPTLAKKSPYHCLFGTSPNYQ